MNIPEFSLLAAFFIGVAGSIHCVGMCGGIVSAFSFAIPKQHNHLPYLVAYNVGRITSYTLAGMLTGALGAFFSKAITSGLLILQFLAAIMLILMALYISGWWKVLTHLENTGNVLWKRLGPLAKYFVPFSSPLYAVPYGVIWGWLPCGLVYSTLSWSLASGSALQGALVMLSFGIGTLPALLLLGTTTIQIKPFLAKQTVRILIALLLFAYAGVLLYGLKDKILG